MKLLAIDTSTDKASVALSIEGQIKSLEQGSQRQHAQFILPMIKQLLSDTDLGLSQLDAIIYGRGPGSFTGLRIACSVAKGLAYAHDLPLLPISTLAAIAEEAYQQTQNLKVEMLSLIDARMKQVYWAYFKNRRDEPQEYVDTVSSIHLPSKEPLILAGVGFESYLDQLDSSIQTRLINKLIIYPEASAMIRIALTANINPVSAAKASPVYIRNQITQGEPHG
jgi:tRNA threonylcarbamoyladenosine biosynthesis protein TsaB